MTVVKAAHGMSEKANDDMEPHEGISLNLSQAVLLVIL